MTTSSVPSGGSGSPSSASVMRVADPSRVKMAPKMLEATARNSTMLDCWAVRIIADRRRFQVNWR